MFKKVISITLISLLLSTSLANAATEGNNTQKDQGLESVLALVSDTKTQISEIDAIEAQIKKLFPQKKSLVKRIDFLIKQKTEQISNQSDQSKMKLYFDFIRLITKAQKGLSKTSYNYLLLEEVKLVIVKYKKQGGFGKDMSSKDVISNIFEAIKTTPANRDQYVKTNLATVSNIDKEVGKQLILQFQKVFIPVITNTTKEYSKTIKSTFIAPYKSTGNFKGEINVNDQQFGKYNLSFLANGYKYYVENPKNQKISIPSKFSFDGSSLYFGKNIKGNISSTLESIAMEDKVYFRVKGLKADISGFNPSFQAVIDKMLQKSMDEKYSISSLSGKDKTSAYAGFYQKFKDNFFKNYITNATKTPFFRVYAKKGDKYYLKFTREGFDNIKKVLENLGSTKLKNITYEVANKTLGDLYIRKGKNNTIELGIVDNNSGMKIIVSKGKYISLDYKESNRTLLVKTFITNGIATGFKFSILAPDTNIFMSLYKGVIKGNMFIGKQSSKDFLEASIKGKVSKNNINILFKGTISDIFRNTGDKYKFNIDLKSNKIGNTNKSSFGLSFISNINRYEMKMNMDNTTVTDKNISIKKPNIKDIRKSTDENIKKIDNKTTIKVNTGAIRGNPNVGNPSIGNPNIGNPNVRGNPNVGGNPNTGNPNVRGNPSIGNPNTGNPNIGNPNVGGNPNTGNPNVRGNPSIGNPNTGNPNIGNPNVGGNPNIGNPNIGNPSIGGNPNTRGNPNIGNPSIGGNPNTVGNPNIGNPSIGGNPNTGNPNIGNPNVRGNPNTGNPNTGNPNIGNPNIGNPNVRGNPNTGNPNTGNPNIGNPNVGGNPNTGNPSIGNPNTGNPNVGGNPNTGNPSIGNPNTGNPNVRGNPNTGNPNTGNPNVGNPNVGGNPNTGNPSIGNPNTGNPNIGGNPNTGNPNVGGNPNVRGNPNIGNPNIGGNPNTGNPNIGK